MSFIYVFRRPRLLRDEAVCRLEETVVSIFSMCYQIQAIKFHSNFFLLNLKAYVWLMWS